MAGMLANRARTTAAATSSGARITAAENAAMTTASSSRRLGRRPWRAQRAVAARRTAVAAGRTARAARMVAAEQGWGVAVVVGPSLVAECARAGARTRTRAGAGSRCAW